MAATVAVNVFRYLMGSIKGLKKDHPRYFFFFFFARRKHNRFNTTKGSQEKSAKRRFNGEMSGGNEAQTEGSSSVKGTRNVPASLSSGEQCSGF